MLRWEGQTSRWLQDVISNTTDCSALTSCNNCIDTIGCTWCSDGTCLSEETASTSCNKNDIGSTCNNQMYVIIFICVLSVLICLCCATCYFRKVRDSNFIDTLPRQLVIPASARNFIFRNSHLAEGEKEWMCIICGFDNHPRNKTCNMCGTDKKFTMEYKAEKKREKEARKN